MRKWFEPVTTSWVVIITHKLRSFLTVLGVVIGVAAVITLMSIGKGTEATILSRFQNLGSNILFVQPGFTTQGGVRGGFGSGTTLTMEDAEAIAENVPNISYVAPFFTRSLQVVAGSQNLNSRVVGITPEYQSVYNLQMASGGMISDYEYERAIPVVLLGSTVKQSLFGDEDPVGQSIRVGTITALVGGVLQSKGSSTMGSPDDSVLIPLTTIYKMVAQPRTVTGESVVNSIAVSVSDEEQNRFVMDEITTLLRYRHKLAATADNDFQITSMEELISAISQTTATMTLMLGAIAAISLLVGGIGVMNIMLVSVVERTREIGVRKALGAKERDIWGQFLVESAFLTVTGGIIGVILGWGGSQTLAYYQVMKTVVAPDTIVLAVSVSVAIGLFFGFYPAWQASRLDPIQALRAE